MRTSGSLNDKIEFFPFCSVFLAAFIVLMNFLYLAEYCQLLSLTPQLRGFGAVVAIILSSIIVRLCLNRNENLLAINYAKYILVIISVWVLGLIIGYWHSLPNSNPHVDEIFRLSFAHSIAAKGLPPKQEWWVFGADGTVNYYVLTEYIASALHFLFEKFLSLQTFYLDWSPMLLTIATGLASGEAVCALLRTNYYRNTKMLLFMTLLFTSLILLGATPYTQGQHHLTYRQNQFGHLILAIVISLLSHEQSLNLNRRHSYFLIITSSLIVCSIINVKILYFPPAAVLVGSYVFLLFLLKRYSIGAFMGFSFLFTLVTLASIKITGILNTNIDTVRGVSFHPLNLVGALGSKWLDPAFLDWRVSVSLTIGLPYLLGLLGLFFAWRNLNRGLESRNALLFSSLALSVTVSLFAGASIQFNAETGGSEAYWLISGWFLFPFLLLSWFNVIPLRTGGWCVAIFVCTVALARSVSNWVTVLPKLTSVYGNIPENCRSIQIGVNHLKSLNANVRLWHSWLDSRLGWAVNGYCGVETITAPVPHDTYGLMLKRSQNYERSFELAENIKTSLSQISNPYQTPEFSTKILSGVDYLLILKEDSSPDVDWIDRCSKLQVSDKLKVCFL